MKPAEIAPSKTAFVAVAALVATVVLGAELAAPASAAPSNGSQNVIVLLRNQHSEAPASKTGMQRRSAVVGNDQTSVRQQISALGGQTTKTYTTLNAVAATVPASAVATLKADPSVASVVPDLVWKVTSPTRTVQEAQSAAAAATPAIPAAAASVCPSSATKPLLEPEALSLTHTNSDVPGALTARALGFDGAGVKVGFIAEGLDINQPDFIRADGSHVITDYKDFSGDGTTGATNGAEAFGDASSIAAQGRRSYDLSTFVNTAHPLPSGCTIRVEGVAPGSSMVAMKVFSASEDLISAPTSTIIQAIDWAVNVDHVDVLNESFGSNPYPDNATDPISAFNHDAVDAGVTVVASSGDSGSGNTLGTGSTDPWVISVGASTSERIYAQQTAYGFQLGNGRYTSNQLSSLSSGGISQLQRVQDLTAPGDLNWSLCSDKLLPSGDQQYYGCTDDNGKPTNLLVFGGTSESAPLTAGAAALVIQSYRKTHGGTSPTPDQVREVLTSSADDLGLPAEEQGSGLLNTYRAVQLAGSLGSAPKTGQGLLLSQTQVFGAAAPGGTVSKTITVTNDGVGPQRVTAALRSVSRQTSSQQNKVNLSASAPTGTFVDAIGRTRSYVKASFSVAPGTDKLSSTIAWTGSGAIVRLSLLDPQGTFAGYSLPQGTGNFGRIELRAPAPGTWTAIIWTVASSAGYTGPVTLTNTGYAADSAGTVSPSSFVIGAGGHTTLTVTTKAPANGAAASSLVLTGRFGQTTTASVVAQTVQPLTISKTTSFSGVFDTANGRSFGPGQTRTYLLDVPAGAPALDITLKLAGTPANQVIAHLSDPVGEPISTVINQHPVAGVDVSDSGLELTHVKPRPGIWQLTLELANPALGTPLPEKFTVSVTLTPSLVSVTGVPTSSSTIVTKASGSTGQIVIHNTSPQAQTYFVDPRKQTERTYPLVAFQNRVATDQTSATVSLPLTTEAVPAWIVPTQSSVFTVGASATDPITFDLMPLNSPTAINAPSNPDIESSTGTSATAVHKASPIASTIWAAFPTLVGPSPADGAGPASATMQATVKTKAFSPDYTSSTGDPMLGTVSSSPPTATPVTIAAGGSATVSVRLRPLGFAGATEQGFLYVDVLQPYGQAGLSGYADEVAAIPFAFKVG